MNAIVARRWILLGLLAVYSGTGLRAQEEPFGPRPVNGEKVKKIHETNRVKYKGAADILVLPGLVAHRKTKRVEVLAESTGLAGGSISEFLLVDQDSANGYEAILWSFARPSDVHAALEFIGVKPGERYDPAQLRFWPKGERINVSVLPKDGTNGVAPIRLETLILDKNTEKPLPETGFVFTGSIEVSAPDGKLGKVYAADAYDPKSVISAFNSVATVLDVPRQANQGEVYEFQVVNPDHALPGGTLLTLVLEPERKDGESRVKNLVLDIAPGRGGSEPAAKEPRPPKAGQPFDFLLKDSAGKPVGKDPTLEGALDTLGGLMKKGIEPYLAVRFDEALKLRDVRNTCLVLGLIEATSGLRIEPPAKGQLYYKAFLPDERWRDPEGRIIQPWELHLARSKGKVAGTLVFRETLWNDDSTKPEIKVNSYDAATPKAVRERLDGDTAERKASGKSPGLAVLLVFVEAADLTYGELMSFVGPALTTHNTVHIFFPLGEGTKGASPPEGKKTETGKTDTSIPANAGLK